MNFSISLNCSLLNILLRIIHYYKDVSKKIYNTYAKSCNLILYTKINSPT